MNADHASPTAPHASDRVLEHFDQHVLPCTLNAIPTFPTTFDVHSTAHFSTFDVLSQPGNSVWYRVSLGLDLVCRIVRKDYL